MRVMSKEIQIGTLLVYSHEECVADYHFVRARTIRPVTQAIRKRGLSGYRIEAELWNKKWEYFAIIDAHWFTDTTHRCFSLREANDWILGKILDKPTGDGQ